MKKIVFVLAFILASFSTYAFTSTNGNKDDTALCDELAVNIHHELMDAGASHADAYETSEGIRILCEIFN